MRNTLCGYLVFALPDSPYPFLHLAVLSEGLTCRDYITELLYQVVSSGFQPLGGVRRDQGEAREWGPSF